MLVACAPQMRLLADESVELLASATVILEARTAAAPSGLLLPGHAAAGGSSRTAGSAAGLGGSGDLLGLSPTAPEAALPLLPPLSIVPRELLLGLTLRLSLQVPTCIL